MNTPISPLQSGTTIAMVSPGGGVPDRFKKQVAWGIEHLQKMGYHTRTDYLTDQEPFNPKKTADALTNAFLDPSISAVLPACGGPRTYEILEYLDFKKIGTTKKLFSGMSDLSPIVNFLAKEDCTPTFYGTHINFLHPKSSTPCNSYTIQNYWNMMCAQQGGKKKLDTNEKIHLFEYQPNEPLVLQNIYARPEYIQKEKYRDVFFISDTNETAWEGTLFSFTLRSIRLMSERGVNFDFSNTILLLDSLGQTHAEIFEDLTYIHAHTNIATSTLLYFSSFVERSDKQKEFPELTNIAATKAFIEKTRKLLHTENILYGFPSGHCQYRLTVPVGVRARVTSETGAITILDKIFT